jgi:hypothetical protein
MVLRQSRSQRERRLLEPGVLQVSRLHMRREGAAQSDRHTRRRSNDARDRATVNVIPAVANVASVLGDVRSAVVNPGDGVPWFNCPFCTTAVFAGDGPKELGSFVGRNGVCNNPWCIANPAMPLDAAKKIVVEAEARKAADEQGQRNLAAVRQRIDDESAARGAAAVERLRECRRRGACIRCANETAARSSKVRYIKHRGPCPFSTRRL